MFKQRDEYILDCWSKELNFETYRYWKRQIGMNTIKHFCTKKMFERKYKEYDEAFFEWCKQQEEMYANTEYSSTTRVCVMKGKKHEYC